MAQTNKNFDIDPVISPAEILEVRELVDEIYIDDGIKDYIVNLVDATRQPSAYGLELENLISYGASPRATINLAKCARSRALLSARAYVIPQDIKDVAPFILGHRVLTTYEADAEEITSDEIAAMIIEAVPVP